MPPHFLSMVAAELRAVFLRLSGKATLTLAVLVGGLCVAAMHFVVSQAGDAQINAVNIGSSIDQSWRGTLAWALTLRNFFVLPLLLVLAGASTMACELADNSLREVMLRPVSRISILLAKLVALAALSASSLGLTAAVAGLGGAAVFSTDAELGPVLLGYAASFASDLGLVLLTLLISTLSRSVGGVVVGIVLYLIVDKGVQLLLKGASMLGQEWAQKAAPFVPGNALSVWEGWSGTWDEQKLIGLAALCLLSGAGAAARFQRMDVP
jgi:ABC-2 type transport system permease protein